MYTKISIIFATYFKLIKNIVKASFIMFFLLVLLVYGSINAYIFLRGWQALGWMGNGRWILLAVFSLIALSFILLMLLKRNYDGPWLDLAWPLASRWAAAVLYLLMALLVIDLVRLLCGALWTSPAHLLGSGYEGAKTILLCVLTGGMAVLLAIGYFNAVYPEVKVQELTIHKSAAGRDSLNVVLVSDLHLGLSNGRQELSRWVKAINAQQPDMVLIAGDMFDDNPAPVERKKLGEILEDIKAPLGVYFAQGNHDGYGDFTRACRYLEAHGIKVLTDTALLIENSFYVVGRLDRSAGMGMALNKGRKSVEELTAGLDKSKAVILLDHQPYELEKAAAAGVDLQVSGHTHHGQIWPFNLITQRMYEKDYGYLQKGNSHFYISEGLGSWGPPVRIATRSEIVLLKVKFMPEK